MTLVYIVLHDPYDMYDSVRVVIPEPKFFHTVSIKETVRLDKLFLLCEAG